MTQYATVDQVLAAYNPLKTMLGTSTTDITTLDINSFFIPNAQAYIDAFVAKRYVVPLAADAMITMLTCDIAAYKICQDRAPRIPDFLKDRWLSANSILGMIRDGEMIITGSNEVVSSGGDQYAWSSVLDNPLGPAFRPIESTTGWDVTSGCWFPT